MAKSKGRSGPVRPQMAQGTARVPSSFNGKGAKGVASRARTGNQPPIK